MKETDFIHQNKDNWQEIEDQLKGKKKARNYNQLGESFVQLSEDLSYAQTYYSRRTVRVYLNNLAQKVYKNVFNARTKDKTKRNRFWTHSLPTAMWESRKELSIALVTFLLACFIGVVSSEYDQSFAQQILGSQYVNMTEENIAKGDPMGVYKHMEPVPMFFMIMYNNLQVSAFTFILGILFGMGTLGIIFKNGVMLGVFQYFFFQHQIGFESFLTIWQHGTIEIASIVVAGGAGLVLGRSLIFPGTLPRSISLKFGFLKGLKILLGVAPLIVLAAFFESFYTRFDDLPVAFRLSTILASLIFVIGYYVVLPIKRGRKISLLKDVEENYATSHIHYDLNLNKLKNNGETLSDVLVIIQRQLPQFMRSSSIAALVLACISVFVLSNQFQPYFYFTPFSGMIVQELFTTIGEVANRFQLIGLYLQFNPIWLWPILAGIINWLSISSVKILAIELPKKPDNHVTKKAIVVLFFVQLLALAPFFGSLWYTPFYFALVLPAIGISWFEFIVNKTPSAQAFTKAFGLFFSLPLKHLGMLLITLLFSLLVAFLVQSPTLYLMFELANDFIGFGESKMMFIVEVIIIFVSLLTFFCSIIFLQLNTILNYRSMCEIKDAKMLMEQINQVSPRKNFYGTSGEK